MTVVTSPDNTEQSGSGRTTDTSPGEPPPWQRVAGDDGGTTPGVSAESTTADPATEAADNTAADTIADAAAPGDAGEPAAEAQDGAAAVPGMADGVTDSAADPAVDTAVESDTAAERAATGSANADGDRSGATAGGYSETTTQWMPSEATTQWMTTHSSAAGAARTGTGQPAAGQNHAPWQQYGSAQQPQPGGQGEEDSAAAGSAGLFGAQAPEQGRPTGGGSRPISALRRPGRGPRRANLQLKRFDPWSVLKLSLVLGVALFFVWLVAVGVLYTVLGGMGVWESINGTYDSLVQNDGTTGEGPLITAGTVFIAASVVGAINIVLISALATVSAFIYNVCADMAGGLEVTLSERE